MISCITLTTLVVGGVMLAGCGSDPTPTMTSRVGQLRAEGACDQKGMTNPLRQTLILVDAKAVQKSLDAADFVKNNLAFRDLVLSIADPDKAVASGTSAARERITLAIVPSDGSAAETTFTGCIPALTPDEIAAASKSQSITDRVFSSGPTGRLADLADAFRLQLIGGMTAIAAKADGTPRTEVGTIEASHFLQGVRASKGMLGSTTNVQRVILVSDLSGLTLPTDGGPGKRFQAGVAAGRRAGGDLELAEVHVVVPAGRPIPDRDFLRGYFLAQDADLAAVTAGHAGSSGPVPMRLWQLVGEAGYPAGPQGVRIRIGDDGQGRLAASWVTLMIDPRYSTPLTGRITCSSEDSCKIASDTAGFAQRWSGAGAEAPHFDRDLPFGGMRNAEFQIAGTKLTGRVYDEAVYLGTNQKKNSIAVIGTAKD